MKDLIAELRNASKRCNLKLYFIRDKTTETDTTEHGIPPANGRMMTAEVTNNNIY